MKRRLKLIAAFCALMLLITLTACAVAAEEPYRYLDLSFETSTFDDVAQALQAQKGVTLVKSEKTVDGTADDMEEFGYLFHFQVDLRGRKPGFSRILLSSQQAVVLTPETFSERAALDIRQFVDMDEQLTALYGEPDWRFFIGAADPEALNKTNTYMFADGVWAFEPLQSVLESRLAIHAYSVWRNVTLQLWTDGREDSRMAFRSRILLSFQPKADKSKPAFDVWPELP